ncbi:MAG: thioredoxin domain-containing protein [Chloroflexi bacterium]|nr:thioredoxin domain-containing protein [Chloroflexota bacterium]
MEGMGERVFILIGVVVAVAAIWLLLKVWRRFKLQRLQHQQPLLGVVRPGKPAVVAFSAPYCHECHTRQAPALARLQAELDNRVVITSLSAPEHPELVDRLGILTVPATVVLDARGTVRHLNLGYASDAKLREQLVQS